MIDLDEPFGNPYLIEAIDTFKTQPVEQGPRNVSRVEAILGKPCRVIPKTEGQSAFFSYRIGQFKLLQPAMASVLEVEYPEDAPGTVVVMNGGNETSSGFHTGTTFGDALYPKYVNNLSKSVDLPLSGEYETWTSLFQLHDRTPNIRFIRGSEEPRDLTPEDGFTVTIAQFSAENIRFSYGAAVSRIRLYAVPNPEQLDTKPRLTQGLPQRRLFWREEMTDGVVDGDEQKRGVTNRLDWWKCKRNRMKFLGFNTFTKDLLEFGAVQHSDTTFGGGNHWALTSERLDWGGWELDHRGPPCDPNTYKDTDGVLMTHAFNRLYTVSDPATFELFRGPSGLALIRHFSLNEHMIYDANDMPIVGYFVVDMERAGEFCMMAEAMAVAKGDPTSIGYLSDGNFNRGFPRYVRSCNSAFLSLPALPSRVVPNVADDSDIVVRQISTQDSGDYFAVVSLSQKRKAAVTIRLLVTEAITDAATGKAIPSPGNQSVKFSMDPFQLRSLHVRIIVSQK